MPGIETVGKLFFKLFLEALEGELASRRLNRTVNAARRKRCR
jgi:hypothetical protein